MGAIYTSKGSREEDWRIFLREREGNYKQLQKIVSVSHILYTPIIIAFLTLFFYK